jgi:hypothetical protein
VVNVGNDAKVPELPGRRLGRLQLCFGAWRQGQFPLGGGR